MPKSIEIIQTIQIIILGLIFIQGLLNAVNPKLKWRIFESWKATKEPTNAFFITRRITGIISMLIVIGLFMLPHLISKQ